MSLQGLPFFRKPAQTPTKTPVEFHFNIPSVFRRVTGLDGQGTIPGRGNTDFSLIDRVHVGSGAHPASYPMGTGGLFQREESDRGVKLTTHLHLVPRSRKMEPNLHAPLISWRGA
jgi:hypothetical protein